MAITVYRRGVKPDDGVFRSTCLRCKSEMEWTATDGQTGLLASPPATQVDCPVCGAPVIGLLPV